MPKHNPDFDICATEFGTVSIGLGNNIAPFEVPQDAAIKLAALLLRAGGWNVQFLGESLHAYKRKNNRSNQIQ